MPKRHPALGLAAALLVFLSSLSSAAVASAKSSSGGTPPGSGIMRGTACLSCRYERRRVARWRLRERTRSRSAERSARVAHAVDGREAIDPIERLSRSSSPSRVTRRRVVRRAINLCYECQGRHAVNTTSSGAAAVGVPRSADPHPNRPQRRRPPFGGPRGLGRPVPRTVASPVPCRPG
jgi:hypothetical protein